MTQQEMMERIAAAERRATRAEMAADAARQDADMAGRAAVAALVGRLESYFCDIPDDAAGDTATERHLLRTLIATRRAINEMADTTGAVRLG
jgi:hypothetical protein